MIHIRYTIFIILLVPFVVKAQKADSTEINTHHVHHHNEIGIGNAPVYFVKEKVLSYGLHLHYLYNLPGTNFGLGVGYEKIFDEHKHNTFALILNYSPVDKLNFSVSPGLASENNEFDKSILAIHFETSYEFEIHDFHVGPVFELAADTDDFHISLGLHLGFGF